MGSKNLLKASLEHVKTVYLSYAAVKDMSKEQRQVLRAVFPNIQKIMLVDDNDKEIDPSKTVEVSNRFGRKLDWSWEAFTTSIKIMRTSNRAACGVYNEEVFPLRKLFGN